MQPSALVNRFRMNAWLSCDDHGGTGSRVRVMTKHTRAPSIQNKWSTHRCRHACCLIWAPHSPREVHGLAHQCRLTSFQSSQSFYQCVSWSALSKACMRVVRRALRVHHFGVSQQKEWTDIITSVAFSNAAPGPPWPLAHSKCSASWVVSGYLPRVTPSQ